MAVMTRGLVLKSIMMRIFRIDRSGVFGDCWNYGSSW
jgi:hypothetical protein